MTRFLHTGDWQLGMTRHFLGTAAQARFTDDRLAAVRAMLKLAEAQRCELVVVCGDVFETNQVDRQTVARTLDALGATKLPVYLLPGNHDPLDAGSVFRSRSFLGQKPGNVTVLDSSTPLMAAPGVELVPAPWRSKRPLSDLLAEACAPLVAQPGTTRIVVGHGSVDRLNPNREDPAAISLEAAERALADGRVHYVALGDRHSLTQVGASGRIWYAGAPEATDYDEDLPGHVLVVDVDAGSCIVTPHKLGRWRFVRMDFDLSSDDTIAFVEGSLAAIPHDEKERCIVKLSLRGSLTLRQRAHLDDVLAQAADLFAAIELWARHSELAVVPDDADFSELSLSGFVASAAERLRAQAAAGDAAARDALGLLLRLVRRGA